MIQKCDQHPNAEIETMHIAADPGGVRDVHRCSECYRELRDEPIDRDLFAEIRRRYGEPQNPTYHRRTDLPVNRTVPVGDSVTVDFSADGEVVGVEVL